MPDLPFEARPAACGCANRLSCRFITGCGERIEARDRRGLEPLVRYCARPIFTSERLCWAEAGKRLVYGLPKPRPDGQSVLSLTPLEWLVDVLLFDLSDTFLEIEPVKSYGRG